MDLRSKLSLYREGTGNVPSPQKKRNNLDIDSLVPGRVCTNDNGSYYVIENRYPPSYLYGGYMLGDTLNAGSETFTTLGGAECGGLKPDRLLYLDTETTGLSGGAGTLAFLVGTGFFEDESFVIRQYFMRDYDEESAMLTGLQHLIAQYDGFVTFNGKAFDINLLLGRFISNRITPVFRDMPNLDLLYTARRIWGLKLESCRLASLEEHILGEFRIDDIPGAQIPSVYFKYLDDRDASDIARVIRHNALDLLSMVSLLARLSSMIKNPLSETGDDYELMGMGRLFETRGRTDDMLKCLEACAGSEYFSVRINAVKRLTGVYKRNGSYERALEHWKAIESENTGIELFHLVEMAKYYEHKVKDYDLALQIVEKAIQNCLRIGLSSGKQMDELKKRKDRLIRKHQAVKQAQIWDLNK